MKQLFTELDGRVLRFDGVSVVSPDNVARLLLLGVSPDKLRVNGESWEIERFNEHVSAEDELKLDQPESINIDLQWRLPEEYQQLDLMDRVVDALMLKAEKLGYTSLEQTKAAARIAQELTEINKRGMMEFMRTVCYILDTFKKNGVVWGVGRGSSCACYILFLLGLHAVDCLRLDVPLEEFFHD